MKPPLPDPARRRLLARTRNTAVAGAALAVLAPVAPAAPVVPQAASEPPRPSRGYRESEHTARYYALARF